MKTLLKFGILSALAIMCLSSCEDDLTGGGSGGGGGTVAADPSTLLLTEPGFVSFEATVMPEDTFNVRLQAEQGDNPLNVLTITEDGSNIDFNRILVDGTPASSNPILLFNDDKVGFTKDISVVSQSTQTTSTYAFRIDDEAGNFSSSSVSITTESVVVPPTIIIEGSGMAMVAPNTILSIPVSVGDVTTPLSTIGVLQDSQFIDAARLWYDDVTVQFPRNPTELPQADLMGFTRTIFVRAHADAGIRTYAVVLTDEAGETLSRDFTIETGSSVTIINGVLFNSAGPAGTGGLDLDDGMDLGSSDPNVEIKDEGIDSGPVESNWIRRISGANGAEVRHIFSGQNGLPDDFDFDNLTTSEQVASLWDNGVRFVDSNTDGDPVSLRIEQGNIFTVSANSKFYVIRVSEINETMNDNEDNYMIDIRF